MINRNQRFFPLLITVLSLLLPVQALRTDTLSPPSHPFMFMLHGPTEVCSTNFNITIDISYFHIVSSTLHSGINQSISMPDIKSFGHIPYLRKIKPGKYISKNNGMPQLLDIGKHLELAKEYIENQIPVDQQGVVVFKLEEWRPQWARNWGNMNIYRERSTNDAMKHYGFLSKYEASKVAELLFERATKKLFVESIRIGKRLRPVPLWGFYRYPDCYNYQYRLDFENYDGKCKDVEKQRDDGLWWLWRESKALFPTIYLDKELRDSMQGRLFVRHHVQETMRVSTNNPSYLIPVYPFVQGVYKNNKKSQKEPEYLTELDLVNTIGEAAALGAAGVVCYMHIASSTLGRNRDTCIEIQQHMEKVFNPYMLNVTKATQLCSEVLCRGQGRCVRKQWDEDVFLHLDPRHYLIGQQGPGTPLTVRGCYSQEVVDWFDIHFDCMCYNTREPCRSVKHCDTIRAGNDTTLSDLCCVVTKGG